MAKFVFALIDDDEEDHDIFRMAIDSLTAGQEIEVVSFLSAGDAISRFTTDLSFIPDFIFIDLNMPKMDGHECARELRKLNQLQRSQLCIYTTSPNMGAPNADRFEADRVICKPHSLNHLSKTLEDLINQS